MNKKISPELWSSVARDKFYLNFINSISQIAALTIATNEDKWLLDACINEQTSPVLLGKGNKDLHSNVPVAGTSSFKVSSLALSLKGSQVSAMKHFKTNVQLRKVPFYRNLGESKYGGEGLDI